MIKQAIRGLEESGYIISAASYNRVKMDKIKWHRIHYENLQPQSVQYASSMMEESAKGEGQNALSTKGILPLAIT